MEKKYIWLPFASEAQYRAYVDDAAQYRQYLTPMLCQHTELWHQEVYKAFYPAAATAHLWPACAGGHCSLTARAARTTLSSLAARIIFLE